MAVSLQLASDKATNHILCACEGRRLRYVWYVGRYYFQLRFGIARSPGIMVICIQAAPHYLVDCKPWRRIATGSGRKRNTLDPLYIDKNCNPNLCQLKKDICPVSAGGIFPVSASGAAVGGHADKLIPDVTNNWGFHASILLTLQASELR